MSIELSHYLEVAKKAAIAAGKALRENQAEWQTVDFQSDRDVKIAGDKKSEEIILSLLREETSCAILSEEKGWLDKNDDQYFWVVDPLDGTVNYKQGIPLCCVSIALMKGREPVLGVVYDFNRDELFSGIIGQGATINDISINVSSIGRPNRGVLNTGFPANSDFSQQAMNVFATEIVQWRKVRMLGTAALSLAYVSCGRSDAYQEKNIMLWDVAAGCALVRAAGGDINIIGDDLTKPIQLLAGNHEIVQYISGEK